MKKQVVFSLLFSFFCLLIISINAFAKETASLKIINVSFGEESISVKTDKGEYILPSHFSGMLDEATFEKILLLIKNKNNKGKTFSFIVEQSNDIDFIIGLHESKEVQISLAGTCEETFIQENYSVAFPKCQNDAKQGDSFAQFAIGIMYIDGLSVQQDLSLGVEWIRKSADQGLVNAIAMLGLLYDDGFGVVKDQKKAAKLIRSAIEQSESEKKGKYFLESLIKLASTNHHAQYELGDMYEKGIVVNNDFSEAIKWYRQAAEKGNIESINSINRLAHSNAIAQYNLSEMYQNGLGVPKDTKFALKWIRKASENGYKDAKEIYGTLLLEDFLFAGHIHDLNKLEEKIAQECVDVKCGFDALWEFIDISKDNKISLAEIARLQRILVKFSAVTQEKKELDTGHVVVLNLAAILVLPITASSIIHSFDYDNDDFLSKQEVIGDSEFANLVGIDKKFLQRGINFNKLNNDVNKLLEIIPFFKSLYSSNNINSTSCGNIESIAHNIAASIAYYYSDPNHIELPEDDQVFLQDVSIPAGISASVSGSIEEITISLHDDNNKCDKGNIYVLTLPENSKDGWK